MPKALKARGGKKGLWLATKNSGRTYDLFMKQLEESLSTKLFVRQNRRLALSQEGKLLLTYADRLLRLASEAETALRNGKPRGTLRIGALESTSATRLPPILSRYHHLYPDVQIELVTGTSGALVARVHKQDVESAFVAEPFNAQGLAMQSVFVEELVLITPKSVGRVRSPKEISSMTTARPRISPLLVVT